MIMNYILSMINFSYYFLLMLLNLKDNFNNKLLKLAIKYIYVKI